jgi:hypothetical protein
MYFENNINVQFLCHQIKVNELHFFPGGAVAVDVAARPEYASRIWCLILENTFTSIPDMAKVLIGWRMLQYLPLCFYKNKVHIVQIVAPCSLVDRLQTFWRNTLHSSLGYKSEWHENEIRLCE